MSLRIDTSEWISGALVIGDTGLGVKGSLIPSTGTNGPGYAYNDLSLPADNAKEICGRITSWPSAGTLFAYEDTSFTFAGPDGTYTALYQLYVDGVATGSPATITFTIGSGNVSPGVGSLTITGYAPTIARTANQAITPGVGSLTVTGYAPAVTQGSGTAVNPGVGSLALTGYAPSITQTANQAISPGVGSVVFAGYAPTVTQFPLSPNIVPGFGLLTITGYAPDVVQTGAKGGAEYEKKKRKYVTKVGDRLISFDDPNVLEMLHPPEPEVVPVKPVKAVKAKAKAPIKAPIKAPKPEVEKHVLEVYEDDEEDIEMLLLAL